MSTTTYNLKELAVKLSEAEICVPETLSPIEVGKWVHSLRRVLTECSKDLDLLEKELQDAANKLEHLITVARHGESDSRSASELVEKFFARLVEVDRLIQLDVRAAMDGDPAAKSVEEVVLSYPSIVALISHRIAHELYHLEIPLLPRAISELAHSQTGIDIHPGAKVGERMFIDHGTGVVIGETAVIGNRVRIYQGVTLGAKSFPVDEHGKVVKNQVRHPVIEDDVIIYSGATILGRVTIGAESIIGGNVWLTRDVPPKSRIVQGSLRHERFEGSGDGI